MIRTTVKIEAEGLDRMLRELQTMSKKPLEKVIKSEAAAVLQSAIKGTRAASVERIQRHVYRARYIPEEWLFDSGGDRLYYTENKVWHL
jgi:division protein CdvB (Snf7/Vps24/ESCRT-III family)